MTPVMEPCGGEGIVGAGRLVHVDGQTLGHLGREKADAFLYRGVGGDAFVEVLYQCFWGDSYRSMST